MNSEKGLRLLKETPIIAIVRGVEEKHIIPVAEALLQGGIKVMEVTLNTPGAPQMIHTLQSRLGDQMFIGAGTVLDHADAQLAVQAGAKFIVTPNTDEEVIRYCVQQDLPVYPGAMTPTEIVKAWKAGATAIKIFPGSSLGLTYLKELQGPLSHIPMIAVGGVNEDNIHQFLQIGCYAFGIGGSLINLQEIAQMNYEWIVQKAERLVNHLHTANLKA